MSNSLSELSPGADRAASEEGLDFFLVAHTMLLGLMLIGFAPTFFLRAFFDVPSIPARLYAHGAVMAVWFAFGPLQGWLMREGNIRWHRRLGYIAATYAALFIVFGMIANAGLIGRLTSAGASGAVIVWANYFTLLMFATFVTLAMLLRGKPEAHKRFALLASISVVGPALGRFPMWSIFAAGMDAGRNFAIGGLIVMLISLIVYDLRTRNRPHPATYIGALVILLSIVAAVTLGLSQAGLEVLLNANRGKW
jgi:hypothetical protein